MVMVGEKLFQLVFVGNMSLPTSEELKKEFKMRTSLSWEKLLPLRTEHGRNPGDIGPTARPDCVLLH